MADLICTQCGGDMNAIPTGPEAPEGGYKCVQCGALARRVTPPKNFTPPHYDELDKALNGDKHAQMRQMVSTLALHLGAVSMYITNEPLKRSSRELVEAALDYLKVTSEEP